MTNAEEGLPVPYYKKLFSHIFRQEEEVVEEVYEKPEPTREEILEEAREKFKEDRRKYCIYCGSLIEYEPMVPFRYSSVTGLPTKYTCLAHCPCKVIQRVTYYSRNSDWYYGNPKYEIVEDEDD